MADSNGWRTWSLQTKLTVGVGLVLAVMLVAGFNFFT
ncbi:hypothetical protein AMOR_46380 [Anaeromyxobacter oryzae]|uniref:Uncharacterized protein n=1 Tax=Anaeromyxobacter oryzae TaxID=2918170 RepID=A0ABN6MXC7_9BACT|nr:hypothetical protein AMOR_46380 [Anaeromyxobacter oryzae]